MKTFRFNFNTELVHKLRGAINEKQEISIKKTDVLRETGATYLAWGRMCVVMDRLEDTMDHINSLELGKKEERSAFDFYEFISCAAVVIDCIRCIGNIFKVDPALVKQIEDTQDVFGKDYAEEGTDKKFFEYIRSLCATHPIYTNRQPMYLNGAKFHCCPFVIWSHHWCGISEKGDLNAVAYTSKADEGFGLQIPLYIAQFERYLGKWIEHIHNVIEAIYNYNESIYEQFRKEAVKTLDDFDNHVDYLLYLKEEYGRRFGDDNSYIFDGYIRIFKMSLTNPSNQQILEKYRCAILYAVGFLHNSMQNMNQEGPENTGIQYEDHRVETDLFLELSFLSNLNGAFSKYSYNLEKAYYLEPESQYSHYDKIYARRLLEEIKETMNQFVVFNNEESDEETIVLLTLAKYLDALSGKTLLNKNIPNEDCYRAKVLSKEEWESLFEEDPKEEFPVESFQIEELLKLYGQ